MVGHGPVSCGASVGICENRPIEYMVDSERELTQVKSGNSSQRPSSKSSFAVEVWEQQSTKNKSAIASIIGLYIPDEEFRSGEKDFQIHVSQSLRIEVAHIEYFSITGRCPVSSSDIDTVLNGDIVEMNPSVVQRFAIDYEGSKALQSIILSHGEASARIYEALAKDIVNLCLDMYGNYTVQCLMTAASRSVASQLGDVIVSNVLPFSLNFYGCRVVQCAMKNLSMEYRVKMCDALEPFTLHCLQSQNANHVIGALLRLPHKDRPMHVPRIHACLCRHALVLARHKYGVTVLRTALESDISPDVSKEATKRLLEALSELVYDEYGNYLVQNLIQENMYGSRHAVHEFLLQCSLLTLACDKFGSNVFETSLLNSDPEQSDALIIAFLEQCQAAGQTDEVLANISTNRYGNYVIQRMLGVSSFRVRRMVSRHLALHCAMLAGSKHGKHIARKLIPDT
ncbi:hypothetical protein M9434_001286 [Picochlorum sp. BPE23]|nr:hypothetical protein M9434_001286 [Picochlorum sp. BPE23]